MQYHMAFSVASDVQLNSPRSAPETGLETRLIARATSQPEGWRTPTVSSGLVPDFSRRVALQSFLIAEPQMMRPK
jgi:hypothetical protein